MVIIKKILGEKEILIRDENLDVRLTNVTKCYLFEETSILIISNDVEIIATFEDVKVAKRYIKAIKKAFNLN